MPGLKDEGKAFWTEWSCKQKLPLPLNKGVVCNLG